MGLVGPAASAVAADGAEPPALLLHYDFFEVDGARVGDGSGHGYAGTMTAGTIVAGRRKPAVRLDGDGLISAAASGLELGGRPLTVGAMCRPASLDGVLLSMGDARDGFALYLKDGRPHFAVRANGVLHEVEDSEPLEVDRWVHLAGVVDASGALSILVNAFPVATSAGPGLLARTPAGAFRVGAEGDGPIGSHDAAGRWRGLVEDVRVYGGAVSRDLHRDLLGDWANRPGCGCRK
ncbi:MAG: LamG domain-containing protein [Vicinamibacteria bacterium]